MRAIDGIDGKHLYVSSLHVCLTNATPNNSTHPPVSTHGMAIEPFRLLNFAGLLHLAISPKCGPTVAGHCEGTVSASLQKKASPHGAGDRRGTWPAGECRSPQPQSCCPPPPPRAADARLRASGKKASRSRILCRRDDAGTVVQVLSARGPTTSVVKAKTSPIFSPLGDARPP